MELPGLLQELLSALEQRRGRGRDDYPKEVPRGEGVRRNPAHRSWDREGGKLGPKEVPLIDRFLSSVARLEEERGLIDPGMTGRLWRKIRRGFGYRIHLIADTRYEIPVAWRVTRASRSEVKELEAMSEALFQETPKLAKRCQDFSADRGLDSGPLKETLWDDYGIGPLIEPRELWKEEKKEPGHDPGEAITRPLYPDRADTLVYTEKGEVCCVCPETGEQRRLAFQGFEAKRGRLKYRCPAAAYGFTCAGQRARRRAPTAGSCGLPLPTRTGGSSPRPRTPARPGSGATGAAVRWSGSTAAWTTTSGSSGTSCGAGAG